MYTSREHRCQPRRSGRPHATWSRSSTPASRAPRARGELRARVTAAGVGNPAWQVPSAFST